MPQDDSHTHSLTLTYSPNSLTHSLLSTVIFIKSYTTPLGSKNRIRQFYVIELCSSTHTCIQKWVDSLMDLCNFPVAGTTIRGSQLNYCTGKCTGSLPNIQEARMLPALAPCQSMQSLIVPNRSPNNIREFRNQLVKRCSNRRWQIGFCICSEGPTHHTYWAKPSRSRTYLAPHRCIS